MSATAGSGGSAVWLPQMNLPTFPVRCAKTSWVVGSVPIGTATSPAPAA